MAKNFLEINKRLEEGEKAEGYFLNRVIEANMGIVMELAHKLAVHNHFDSDEEEDLVIMGSVGLSNAASTFDSGKQVKFSTWATRIVRQEMLREVDRIKKGQKKQKDFAELSKIEESGPFVDEIVESVVYEEEREKQKELVTRLIRENTKGVSSKELEGKIDIFLEFSGLADGKRKSVTEIKEKTNRKRSSIIRHIRSCQRILRSQMELPQNMQDDHINEAIKEKDLILLNYIIEKNKDGIYPNSTMILSSPVTSRFFFSRSVLSESVRRLKDLKGCRFELMGRGQGYKLLNADEVTNLTGQDRVAISIVALLLKEYENTPFQKSFKSMWHKLQESEGIILENGSFSQEPVSIITDPLPEISSSVFNKLLNACREHKSITFQYASASSSYGGKRRADPYHIVCQKGSWYLLCYNHKTEDFRWFSFSRFKNVTVLNEVFEFRDDFRLDDYFDSKTGILWSTEKKKVSILVHANIARFMAERQWFHDQELNWRETGEVQIDFSTTNPQELSRFIMQWSPDIEVLAPEELKKEIKKLAQKTASYY